MTVNDRELILLGERSHVCGEVGRVRTVLPIQELLILPLELEVEDHAVDAPASLVDPRAFVSIYAEELRVVRKFARFHEPDVVLLAAAAVLASMLVEELLAISRQDDDVDFFWSRTTS